jgi:plastocyanin
MKFAAVIVVFALVASAYADVYMHNPRGGNNRVDDANNAPANRLFDSQNNNQAGYNSGEEGVNMKYYQSSELMIGWTSQHGCGINPQTHCDMIIQYRCDTLMRNGVSRERPEDNLDTAESEPSADRGRHEPYSNWLECRTRDRNEGLFIADQNVGGQARNTRQNAGGGRSGYECAEERDYYPYWHPSMWKDIAVMTDNTTRCAYYQAESQNVKAKGTCSTVTDNNPISCAQNGGDWIETPSFGLAAPDCVLAPWGRANIHGNAVQQSDNGVESVEQAHYNATLDMEPSTACVIRLRYNISTDDYDGWTTDARFNDGASPVEGDPLVSIGAGTPELQLNINTAQFGRTFEDRSHIFEVMARPGDLSSSAKIYNMNVRGKRGNNAATYPSNEYDFVPNRMHIKKGDAVHWQWTGSENNNNGNDRNNALQIEEYGVSYPMMAMDVSLFKDDATIKSAAASCGSEDANLQDVTPYCDVGLVVMDDAGEYHFMSVKNNAYSNRSQKGTIIVEDGVASTATTLAFIIGGVAVVGAGGAAALVWKKKSSSSGGRF